jgi:peptidoglycan/xylan/chitin deacetylase (PgdA/CDA1 family)
MPRNSCACSWHRDCILLSGAPPHTTMQKFGVMAAVSSILASCCCAQTPAFTVLPWNAHRAAISLTFDDARPVHLDLAVPELNKRHLHASFFVIVSKLTRLDDWRRVMSEGHEIGNHSVSHEHVAALTRESEETQVEDAKSFLDSNFHANVCTFAYPYTETSKGLAFWVKRYNFAARGWRGDGDLLYLTTAANPDWYNLPSQPSFTKYDFSIYRGWVDRAMASAAWTTLQIHGIGESASGFEPIPTLTFLQLLDYLKQQERAGLWVAPFGEVAAYLRAEKVLEAAPAKTSEEARKITWETPKPFPHGIVLKITLPQRRTRVYQAGHELRPDKKGIYSVSFDAQELVIKEAL